MKLALFVVAVVVSTANNSRPTRFYYFPTFFVSLIPLNLDRSAIVFCYFYVNSTKDKRVATYHAGELKFHMYKVS